MDLISTDFLKNDFVKEYITSEKPGDYLNNIRKSIYFNQLPELKAIIGVQQNPKFHPEGDVWQHTLMVCDEASFLCNLLGISGNKRSVVLLSALCHDLGKAEKTFRFFGKLISHGHEKAGVKHADSLLSRIGIDLFSKEKILKLVEYHHIPLSFYRSEVQRHEQIRAGAFRKSIERIYPAALEELLLLSESDYCGRNIEYEFVEFKGIMKKKFIPGEWFVEKMIKNGFYSNLGSYYMKDVN
jgi:tRNA nucleotidyltransferase (CCA-adding enzyme)